MRTLDPDDIGDYALLRSRCADDGSPTTIVTHVLWFPDRNIEVGDSILVYSKAGKQRRDKGVDGSTTHVFFWHSKEPLWSDRSHAAILLHVDMWKTIRPPRNGAAVASKSAS